MDFAQVGRVLTLLEVLIEITYDEECRFVNEKKENENKRRFAEMCLHEQLWRVLTRLDAQQDVVPTRLLFGVLWVVLNPANFTEKDAAARIVALLTTQGSEATG